jgi:hypothetical protein
VTFRDNGARDTDHWHGSIYRVLGGGISRGRAGEQFEVSPATLNQGCDLPALNDYHHDDGEQFVTVSTDPCDGKRKGATGQGTRV